MPSLSKADFPDVSNLDDMFVALLRVFSTHGMEHSAGFYTMGNATFINDTNRCYFSDVWINEKNLNSLVQITCIYNWNKEVGVIIHGTGADLKETIDRKGIHTGA